VEKIIENASRIDCFEQILSVDLPKKKTSEINMGAFPMEKLDVPLTNVIF